MQKKLWRTPPRAPAPPGASPRRAVRSFRDLLARKLRFQFPPTESESESESGGGSGGESDTAGAIDEFWDDCGVVRETNTTGYRSS